MIRHARAVRDVVAGGGCVGGCVTTEGEGVGKRRPRDEAERLLEQRRLLPAFRNDTNTLLRHDFGYYDVDAAATLVRELYFRHLRSNAAS